MTTELGLCVAIPALLLGNILNGWAARLKGTLEFSALRMINTVRCADAPLNDGPVGDLHQVDAWSNQGQRQAV